MLDKFWRNKDVLFDWPLK